MAIVLASAAVVLPIVATELALGRAKLQTALARVLVIWLIGYAAASIWLVSHGEGGFAALTIFWSGAFLAWFGVRSHVESSILLRMLFLLRKGPLGDATLVDAYVSHYGEGARVDELARGGLVAGPADAARVTLKGKVILLVASKLR